MSFLPGVTPLGSRVKNHTRYAMGRTIATTVPRSFDMDPTIATAATYSTTGIARSSTQATQRRKRFAFFPCPDDGTKSLHQEQKTESGTISFLQFGQFIRTSRSTPSSLSASSARQCELVAPGVVVTAKAVVGPDDHGVGAGRWRGRGDLHRRGPDAGREERAGRGHQPDPGMKAPRYRGHLAHAQRDVVPLRGRERPLIEVAQV